MQDALAARHPLDVVYVSDERVALGDELSAGGVTVVWVENELLAQACSLKSSPGVIALGPTPRSPQLAELSLGPSSLVLVVAGVANPGNLGALARSAEAAGASALITLAGGSSPWNSKALRGSMGSLLRLPVIAGAEPIEVMTTLRERGLRQVAAATRGGTSPFGFDWSGPVALWIAPETGEFPDQLGSLELVTIPTTATVESLNVTVAASVLLFAAGRVSNAVN